MERGCLEARQCDRVPSPVHILAACRPLPVAFLAIPWRDGMLLGVAY